ncbi:MAG: LolA family protein [Salibacteraceae bacterium]
MIRIPATLLFFAFSATLLGQNFKPVQNKVPFQNQLKEASQKTNSVTSTFTQVKFLSFMEEEVHSSGQFFFTKPNKVRWEYLLPSKYYIIINGNKIITFMNGKVNEIDASKNKSFSEINKIMLGSINGDIAQHEDFESELFETENVYRLNLKPKVNALKEVMTEIVIWFDKSNMSVSKIKMMEASGDHSLITLENKKLNEAISPSKFNP